MTCPHHSASTRARRPEAPARGDTGPGGRGGDQAGAQRGRGRVQGSGPTWKETQQVTVTTEAFCVAVRGEAAPGQHLAAKEVAGRAVPVPGRKHRQPFLSPATLESEREEVIDRGRGTGWNFGGRGRAPHEGGTESMFSARARPAWRASDPR